MKKNFSSAQAQRCIYMLKKFQFGVIFTSKELREYFRNEYPNISLRTIQRDLALLQECEPRLERYKEGRESFWRIPRSVRPASNVFQFQSSDLLSFHILKAYLKTFKNSAIDESIKRLTKVLEEIVPDDVYLSEIFYWDKNVGHFNYSGHIPLIRSIINHISAKQLVRIEYHSKRLNTHSSFEAVLRTMFNNNGFVYTVAYIPKHKEHVPLAVQNIESIEPVKTEKIKLPKFDFTRWSDKRFGVFGGTVKFVKLKVKKDYEHYFINRFWHHSQEVFYSNDDLILQFRVPLGPDFISWVMSWGEAFEVIQPNILKERLIKQAETVLSYYK
jgi:predicted DNA-binding transcriptional regulator YafY